MSPGLLSAGGGDLTLYLMGGFFLLTMVVHVCVSIFPLRAEGRCIFRQSRAGIARWFAGELSPTLSLFWGLLLTVATMLSGIILSAVPGREWAMLAGPLPGVAITVPVLLTSLRRLRGHGLRKIFFSALTSLLLMLFAGLLLLLISGGGRWGLLLQTP
ncbi:hypothetical protein HCH73_19055 [Citrobacter koseri]|uniref:hypothetical protein n=1 Tax=Citrobacter koseri TaxID=545 RepID=UPI0018E12417|nr:hypothetical protein [Citrobacter koseri]MBI0679128.1 hypothetical protein [Citrobacter koseri]